MNNTPICDHPRTILNPDVFKLIHKYHNYVVDGVHYTYKGKNYTKLKSFIGWRYGRLRHRVFLPNGRYKLVDDEVPATLIQNSYVYSDEGELFPFYIQVPCGICANCVYSKQSSFVQRCYLESQSHLYWPWFVTLTYKDIFLPRDGELRVQDIQNFFKRFRVLLERKFDGKYNVPIRYAYAGEYGKRGRCHWHLIIWGLPTPSSKDFANVQSLIRFAWSKRIVLKQRDYLSSQFALGRLADWYASELLEFGFKRQLIGWVTSRAIDLANDKKDHTFKYTSKYICKPPRKQHLPFPTAKRPFLMTSRTPGIGSIGKQALLELFPSIDKTGRTKPLYVEKFTRSINNLYTNKWVIDSLFPSKSRVVPCVLRKAFHELCFHCRKLCIDFAKPYLDVYRKYYYDPFSSYLYDRFHDPELLLIDCKMILERWFDKLNIKSPGDLDKYFKFAQSLQIDRERFLSGLFVNSEPVNIEARHYRASIDIQRQISLERL